MTVTEGPTIIEDPIIEGVEPGEEHLHVTCCRRDDEFICGHPFHPELEAGNPGSECDCPQCERMLRLMACGSRARIHFHCPFDLRRCDAPRG